MVPRSFLLMTSLRKIEISPTLSLSLWKFIYFQSTVKILLRKLWPVPALQWVRRGSTEQLREVAFKLTLLGKMGTTTPDRRLRRQAHADLCWAIIVHRYDPLTALQTRLQRKTLSVEKHRIHLVFMTIWVLSGHRHIFWAATRVC